MRLWFTLAIGLALAAVAGKSQNDASLSGTVVSEVKATYLPLSTVRVELRKHGETTAERRGTDEAGRYSFTDLKPGSYDLDFQAPPGGFEPGRIEIKQIEVKPQERRELPTIRLSWVGMCEPQTAPSRITMFATVAAPKLTGIVEVIGSVLSGVRLQLRSYADLHHPVSITTDKEGHYEFRNVAPGKYTISTQAPGLYYQGFDVYVYPGFDMMMPNVRMERCETPDCIPPLGLCE